MLAVQGPAARELAAPLLPQDLREPALALKPFHAVESPAAFVGRTGYTGEDGWEILLPAADGRRASGTRCSPPASRPAASAPATRCVWKPA